MMLETCRNVSFLDSVDIRGNYLNKVVIAKSRMVRMFAFKETKYLSLALPFTFRLEDGRIGFYYKSDVIDSLLWSKMITKYRDHSDMDSWMLDYLVDESLEASFYFALAGCDLGYVRYDWDEEGYRAAVERNAPHQHPKHHLDIHHSDYSTFKVGLDDGLSPEDFIEIVNNENDRWYVNHSRVGSRTGRRI